MNFQQKQILFNPKLHEQPGTSEQEIIQIKEAFDFFDKDGSGSIQIDELKAAMLSLGFQINEKRLEEIMNALDKDNTKSLEFEEFLDLMKKKINENDTTEKDYQQKIKSNEYKNKLLHQKISFQMLKNIAVQIGENLQDDELIEMITKADKDKDGLVGFDDFKYIMKWQKNISTSKNNINK
ncbi:variant sh3 domain protein [Ichthyophthirius multifiliis]|uniref:Variant sh3 domain protein n=1 Tax=Ichthyophthirius multifiliis TaxID=5932 RepID=G0R264_ICHMU|nr:variant sh3 domain protein [Ichthyophthirius multifiliis]EGR28444.1 variant sh3 domain protein [Ichthyophthirius multifiliis]|eukprot:XP_004029680.1 variant sh3 domain protein [Ichthyophthirius multifiliis]